jgi:hypothetical protein
METIISGEAAGALHQRPIQTTKANHPNLCHPDRSEAKWRDLRFSQTASDRDEATTLTFVIPTEVEGSAVLSTSI